MNANPMHATCGAHCRTTGEPRKNRPLVGKLRCRMHGGRAGRPTTTTGEFTKDARAATKKRGEITRLIREISAELKPVKRR